MHKKLRSIYVLQQHVKVLVYICRYMLAVRNIYSLSVYSSIYTVWYKKISIGFKVSKHMEASGTGIVKNQE